MYSFSIASSANIEERMYVYEIHSLVSSMSVTTNIQHLRCQISYCRLGLLRFLSVSDSIPMQSGRPC